MGISLGDWPSWLSLAVSALALGVAIVAAVFAGKQVDAAKEANRIQSASLDVARRQLELQQRQAEAQVEGGLLPYVPPWKLMQVSRNEYALVNGGTDTEHDVRVSAEQTIVDPQELGDIGPKDSRDILIVFTMSSPSRSVTVEWTHGNEKDRRRLKLPVSHV